MVKKGLGKVVIVGLEVLVVGASLGYAYYSNMKYNSLETELKTEKTEIESSFAPELETENTEIKFELDALIVQYDAKTDELVLARKEVVTYKDSLQAEKNNNFKNKIAENSANYLREKNKELFFKVQELSSKEDKLNEQSFEEKEIIQQQELDAWEFANRNEILSNKVATAAELSIGELKIISMKKLSNGSYKETLRSKKTDSFKVSFEINENLIADKGSKVAYLIVKNPLGEVVTPSGKFLNGEEELYYSEMAIIDYKNKAIEVIAMNDINREETIKGVYTITTILDGKSVGEATAILK